MFKDFAKKDVIYLFVILLICGCLFTSVKRCSSIKDQYTNNIEALKDTIKYHKAKNGDLVASKRIFESKFKDLKILNDSLYFQLKNLKPKSDIVSGIHTEGTIIYVPGKENYIIKHDTITKGFIKDFDFSNKWRTLTGNISYKEDTLNLNFNKDIVNFDYTIGIDKKNNVYISSSNPYVKYDKLNGFKIPNKKQKHWNIGPTFGYGLSKDGLSPYIGLSIGYGIIQF